MVNKSQQFVELDQQVAIIAKAISHPARVAILKHLAGLDNCMCGDIVDTLPLAQSTVSQHLKYLKQAGLITGEVDGPRSCYCINLAALQKFRKNINTIFDQLDQLHQARTCC